MISKLMMASMTLSRFRMNAIIHAQPFRVQSPYPMINPIIPMMRNTAPRIRNRNPKGPKSIAAIIDVTPPKSRITALRSCRIAMIVTPKGRSPDGPP